MRSILRIMATAKELWPLYLGIVVGALMVSATALMTPFVIGRAKAVQMLDGVTPLRSVVDTYITWLLRQRLRSYGHPEFRTDAATYRHATPPRRTDSDTDPPRNRMPEPAA